MVNDKNYIEEYLSDSHWRKNENANINESFSGLYNYVSAKIFANDFLDSLPIELRKAHDDAILHIHNLESGGYIPYSYNRQTPVVIKRDGKKLIVAMENVKIGDYVLDKAGAEFTLVTDMIFHDSHCDMLRIKLSNGSLIEVTEDHPIIMHYKLRTKQAKDLQIGDLIQGCNISKRDFSFDGYELNRKLSWLIGMYIAEGNKTNSSYRITQDKGIFADKILQYLNELSLHYWISEDNNKQRFNIYNKQIETLPFNTIKEYAINKNIPYEALTLQSYYDIISGIIDGDGCRQDSKFATRFNISTQSYELVHQIKLIFDVARIVSSIRYTEDKMYHIDFYLTETQVPLFRESIKVNSEPIVYFKGNKNLNYFSKEVRVVSIDKIPYIGKVVTDITTETHTFCSMGLKLHNCAGHNLKLLLMNGMKTQSINSRPAKHLNSVVDHVMNFLYCSQMEFSGAQSFSDADTLLAPYIKKDKLVYKDVKQQIQKLCFNLNFTMRAASQCIDEDTQILTINGWKGIDDITENDDVLTLNMNGNQLEYCKIQRIVKYDVSEPLVRLYNKRINQLVTPNHRVVCYKYWTNDLVFREAKEVFNYDSSWLIPLNAPFDSKDYDITDNELKLHAWIISEGNIRKDNRIAITQSIVNQKYIDEIKQLLTAMNIPFKVYWRVNSGFSNNANAQIYLKKKDFPNATKEIPEIFHRLSRRQCKLFLDEYRKGDGCKQRFRLYTNSKTTKDFLIELAFKAGYSTSSRLRDNGVYDISIVRDFKDRTWNVKAETMYYKGRVWCVTSQNQTMVIKKDDKVCITGNTPFTNLTLNFGIPKFLENEHAIIGGFETDFTYGDCLEETYMIDRAFIEVMNEMDPNGKPLTFPILTANLTTKFPWDSDLALLLAKNCSTLGSFYFMNYLGSGIAEDTARSMCCRLKLDLSKFNGPKGLWNMGEGVGSLGVVTINLPRLGYEMRGKSEDEFFRELNNRLEMAITILQARKLRINKYMKKLMPFSLANGWSMKNYFMTIGILGLDEMCANYTHSYIVHDRGNEFATKVITHIRDWTINKQAETKQLINMEMVPAEGCSYRLAKADVKTYPNITISGRKEAPYYSALLIPASYNVDMADRIDIEEKLLPQFTGGTIFRTYIGEKQPTDKAMLDFIKLMSKTKIPYFDITATYSICNIEGKYIRGPTNTCPSCGGDTEIFSRVVGYYRPFSKYNIGKKMEFKERRYTNI